MIDNTEIQHIYQTANLLPGILLEVSWSLTLILTASLWDREISPLALQGSQNWSSDVRISQGYSSRYQRIKQDRLALGLVLCFTVNLKDNDDIKRIKQKDRIQIISSYSSKESRNVLISVTTLSLKGKRKNLTKCTRDILLIRNNQLLMQYWDKYKWQWFDN